MFPTSLYSWPGRKPGWPFEDTVMVPIRCQHSEKLGKVVYALNEHPVYGSFSHSEGP